MADLFLVLGLNPRKQIDKGLRDRRQDRFTGGAHLVRDVEFGGLSFGRDRNYHPTFGLTDETPFLLPITDHMNGNLGLGVMVMHQRQEPFVNGVAGVRQRPLIRFGGITALHDTKIRGAGADIDNHRVKQCFQTVGHRERFRH